MSEIRELLGQSLILILYLAVMALVTLAFVLFIYLAVVVPLIAVGLLVAVGFWLIG